MKKTARHPVEGYDVLTDPKHKAQFFQEAMQGVPAESHRSLLEHLNGVHQMRAGVAYPVDSAIEEKFFAPAPAADEPEVVKPEPQEVEAAEPKPKAKKKK